jgi:phage tail sheath protein FI
MPEYLRPGIHIEDVSFRPKSIEGVNTRVAGFIGPTHCGPVGGKPTLLTSFADFERIYGEIGPLNFGGKLLENHMSHAARAFFENGGQELYVARVHEPGTTDDGALPSAAAYEGQDAGDRTGLKVFEALDEISIIAAPGNSATTSVNNDSRIFQIAQSMISHCQKMRYRIAILDSKEGQELSEVKDFRGKLDSTHAALYYPWITIIDPLDANRQRRVNVPPSGFVAGIYARTDIARGVWKAPANEIVDGAVGFELPLDKGQQDVLNPLGINCLRYFEGRGYRVLGARTISSDPEWKFVNVRRYMAYLEHSIDKGTQWAVFENNNEKLWANIRQSISDFLFNEWKNGALQGMKPEEAFFARCDRSTMTQTDLGNGRLVCLIGVAVAKPAEFLIFRIGQLTADRVIS